MHDKKQLRKIIKERKRLLTPQQALSDSLQVMRTIERLPEFVHASRIMLYAALPDELPTQQWIERWRGTKQLFLPRICGDDLEILPIDTPLIACERFGVMEPTGNNTVCVESLDLVIVPGIAFDANRYRLGRGKGFYDRLLSGHDHIPTIGVAHDCQFVPQVPHESHDVPMHIVITPSHIILKSK